MVNRILLFLFSAILSVGFSQQQEQGDWYFENFEYTKAASSYNQVPTVLNDERLEKLTYCYFVMENAQKGLPLSDSLIRQGSPLMELWKWKAHFERSLGQFDNAIQSNQKYIDLGGTKQELLFKESCLLWQKDLETIQGNLLNDTINDTKANQIIHMDNIPVYFFEIGLDSLGNEIGFADKNIMAEIPLMRPFIEENGILKEWLVLDDKLRNYSMNSLQFDKKSGIVYFSVSQPIAKVELDKYPTIYRGKSNGIGQPITEIAKMNFGGTTDSSACMHLALNLEADRMLFVMYGAKTKGSDLFTSVKNANAWSTPTALSLLNSSGDEMFPVLSGDTLLSFSSDGRVGYGGLDLFQVKINADIQLQAAIQHLPLHINSISDDFLLNTESKDQFTFVSNRSNGKGDDDIWSFQRKIEIVPAEEPIPDPIAEPVVEVLVKSTFDLDAFLKDCNSNRIYFAFNQGITNEKFEFVEKLNELIKEGLKFSILVTGYADSRGAEMANHTVGMTRSKTVKKDLIAQGIPANIIMCNSEGSTKIENRCKANVNCSEEEHSQNRYVQLTIKVIN